MGFCTSCKPYSSTNLLYTLVFVGLVACLPAVSAFGSGKIPDAAYLKGKAWRHGDIDDVLEGLVKVAGQGGGAIIGAIASAFFSSGSGEGRSRSRGGKKFSGLDVKRVYFGNWLRDLSQVCDIAGFKAMTGESLVICIMTMGFLTFGYATREFQVTRERLSVYLLTEHIDNPKGYGEGEDPQSYDPRLRPRVDEERELEIDQRNGMKKYIASDNESFDTSTKCIRRTFRKCIQIGREARAENNEEKEHESFRLLGTGLHTLEDFSAHSNWCELALQKLGHKQVFAHVGENVRVNSPDGPVPPLVTGTFAGADFCFSMLGEASDKLSSASIGDLTAQLDDAQNANKKSSGGRLEFIKSILSKLPLGGANGDATVDDDLDQMDRKKKAFDLDGRIDQLAPEKLQQQLWDLFVTRDNLMRRIEELIEGVPGLGDLLDNLSLALTQWIMITIDPYVRPILLQASSAIGQGSQAVISGNDQWTVFNDPNASDPTHSVLAKDHFSNILNDPAGNISVIIVKYTVNMIVDAWSNEEDPDRVIDQILEALHHPNYANRNSQIQMQMMDYMRRWVDDMDADDREITINSLTKDSIRNHRNQRKTSEDGPDPRLVGGRPSHDHVHSSYPQGSNQSNTQPSRPPARGQDYGNDESMPSYRANNGNKGSGYDDQRNNVSSYPSQGAQYGSSMDDGSNSYARNTQAQRPGFNQSDRHEPQNMNSYGQSDHAGARNEYHSVHPRASAGHYSGQDQSSTYRGDSTQDRAESYGGSFARPNRGEQHAEEPNAYRLPSRDSHTTSADSYGGDGHSRRDNSSAYNRNSQTTDSRRGGYGDDEVADYSHGRRNDTEDLSDQSRRVYSQRSDGNDGYGRRVPEFPEANVYRTSEDLENRSGGFSQGSQRRDQGHDEYDGGHRQSGQAYDADSRSGRGHRSDSHERQRSARYVDSQHHRRGSSDSNSSKDSHKKHHSKHKSKSKSRSRDRNDRRHHGHQENATSNFDRQTDYGMGRLNMSDSRRDGYDQGGEENYGSRY